jgi:hypothetical protein
VNDSSGNFVRGVLQSRSVSDNDNPSISGPTVVISDPKDTIIGWVNISCTITDNIAIGIAWLNITHDVTYPIADINYTNVSLTQSGNLFYYNATLSDVGNHNYSILTKDTSNNMDSYSSADIAFDMPPNWDILIDHDCNINDLIYIANNFEAEETDPNSYPGWLREDLNNDGQVSIVDLIQVTSYFDDTW